MNRLLTVVAATGAIWLASQALAADSDNQSTLSDRQLIAQIASCMRARMSANKGSSYKDAFKTCKSQVIKGNDNIPPEANMPPDAVPVSGTQAKP
jgi:hypothetical protein